MVESPPYGILFLSYTRTRKVRAWQVLGAWDAGRDDGLGSGFVSLSET